jgi:hypothetical protein
VIVLGLRVLPNNREQSETLFDDVLEKAAPRREVEGVVFVDDRRNDEDGPLPDLLCLRRVLQQLEHLGA